MRAFLWVSAIVLAVIGIGVGVEAGTSPSSLSSCLADMRTRGEPVAMPIPTRVTKRVQLPGNYALAPPPASYRPGSSPRTIWKQEEGPKEPTASYQLLLGRFVLSSNLPLASLNGTLVWVVRGEHLAGVFTGPLPHGMHLRMVCGFGEYFDVYNATTGRAILGYGS